MTRSITTRAGPSLVERPRLWIAASKASAIRVRRAAHFCVLRCKRLHSHTMRPIGRQEFEVGPLLSIKARYDGVEKPQPLYGRAFKQKRAIRASKSASSNCGGFFETLEKCAERSSTARYCPKGGNRVRRLLESVSHFDACAPREERNHRKRHTIQSLGVGG